MNSTFNVLFCTDYLPPSDGGVEHVVDELARRLSRRGHSISVFTLGGDDEQIDLRDHPDITVFTADKVDLTEYVGLQSAVAPGAVWEFKQVVEETDPDIVHVHNRFFFTSFVGLAYKHYFGYSLVTSLHLGELTHLDGLGGSAATVFQTILSKQLVRQSEAVICVSDAVRSIAKDLGATPERTVLIPNAVDLDQFDVPLPSFDKTVLYVGRLVRNNGPQDLVASAPAILQAHPDARIHIVGSGTLQSDLETEVSRLGLDDRVTIHGFVDDVTEWYARADVFCRPSYSEGLPLTLLESMATRSVPVVTPVAGSSEIVEDGANGRLVPVGDVEAIAETVVDLLDRPDTTTDLSNAAQEYVKENNTWEQRAENVISVYEQVSSA